jgi:hypothetical protein
MAAPSKTWNIQNYILAALGGTLAATATVIMVSAIFRPARISFFVTPATCTRRKLSGGDWLWLHLTVSANSSGPRRTQVKYESIFVELVNSTTDELRAALHATAWPKDYLPSPSLISVDASSFFGIDKSTTEDCASNLSNFVRGLTVVVRAQVHFRVGVVPTRLYGIKVFCGGVHFTDDQDSSDATVNCHS